MTRGVELVRTHDRLFIGGEWVAPATTATIEVVSPHTEQVIARVPEAREPDVDAAVAAARTALVGGPWPAMGAADRADLLSRLSAGLQARMTDVATAVSEEMGSPISWSTMAQAFAPTMILDYYAGLARTYPFEELRQGVIGQTLVRREPVGVVAAIVPWNVPLFVTMAKLSPALAAGCTVVLKPSPETPLDAIILAEVLADVGAPPGIVNILPAGREVGEYLVTHPGIDKVSFTGSTLAGKRIASLCGERLRRCSLELGGKSAAVVLDDARFEEVVPGLVDAALMNNGEACVAQTRILAPRDRYSELVEALSDRMRTLAVGDPLDPATVVGPLAAARQRDRVEGYIAIGQKEGAKVAIGGGRPAGLGKGWYVEPTLFVDVDNSMRIAQEEIFGPVVCVIPYGDTDEAVAIANDSHYGLSGSVWTADPDRGVDVARRVRTGTYTVNGFTLDFATPFGGFKESGIGREFGPEGLELFLEFKSINLPAGYTPTLA
jgi:aldehyde dehydrogenase (NAD+)